MYQEPRLAGDLLDQCPRAFRAPRTTLTGQNLAKFCANGLQISF
jgi:hypothetical protein